MPYILGNGYFPFLTLPSSQQPWFSYHCSLRGSQSAFPPHSHRNADRQRTCLFPTVPWHLSIGERHCHFLPSVTYFLFKLLHAELQVGLVYCIMPLILLHAQVNMTLLPPNFFLIYSMLVRFVISGRMSCPHFCVQRVSIHLHNQMLEEM
uniref:Uncharacterized protein n=1 Tax=Triticum urartu TaxID=4572 RepID=A0A8R7UBS3_TRIUA